MKRKKLLSLVLSLSILAGAGFTINTNAYAATTGEQVVQPEEGWSRYSCPMNDLYEGRFHISDYDKDSYDGLIDCDGGYVKGRDVAFTFYGSKIRLYYGSSAGNKIPENAEGIISFDGGETWEKINEKLVSDAGYNTMFYEKDDLDTEMHDVKIKIFNVNEFNFNGFDIDENGEVLRGGSLTIDKRNLDMVRNEEVKINYVASLNSSSDRVIFSSSDESVATVDEKGLVKAVGKGEARIKVELPGRNLVRYCKVKVTNVPRLEEGWQRIEPSNNKIYKGGFWEEDLNEDSYGGNINSVQDNSWGRDINFAFYGTKLRLYFDDLVSEKAEGVISFDNGETWEKFDPHTQNNTMVYEKEGLDLEYHQVRIKVFYDNEFSFECFDIDNDGELLDGGSITINKTKLNLVVNEQEQLSLPNVSWGDKVTKKLWSSSDESVATVDENGLVTAVGAGEAKITVRIEGKNLVKVCKVTVKEPEFEVGEVEFPNAEDTIVIDGNKVGDNGDITFEGNPDAVVVNPKNGIVLPDHGTLVIDPALKDINLNQEPGNSDIKLTVGENAEPTVKVEISDAKAELNK